MKLIIAVILTILFTTGGFAQERKDEDVIRRLLDEQSAAWNRGSIDDFMKGYWESDSLLFIGKNGPKYGYSTTLANYKEGYPDTVAMGKLHFDLLQLRRLSPEYYFVVGKWQLFRSIGDLQGYFTLLFRKIKHRWVVVADHSS